MQTRAARRWAGSSADTSREFRPGRARRSPTPLPTCSMTSPTVDTIRVDEPRRPGARRRARLRAPWPITSTCPVAAVRHRSRPVYGLQFHPEVGHTPYGTLILGNFLDADLRIPRAPGRWTRSSTARWSSIRAQVGPTDRVVCGLSAESTRPWPPRCWPRRLGPRVVCVFVDNGLLRAGTSGRRCRGLPRRTRRRAPRGRRRRPVPGRRSGRDRAPGEAGADRPHVHRRLPGRGALDRVAGRFLAQGTLYPDVIESGGALDGPAATIKHHHNVGGLPAELRVRTDRAPARPVQGRGSRARPASSACRRTSSARIRSPVPAWRSAAWVRSPPRGLQMLRQADTISSRSSQRRALRHDRRRPSPCCCRCSGGRDGRRSHL